jgi:hypothetical protein
MSRKVGNGGGENPPKKKQFVTAMKLPKVTKKVTRSGVVAGGTLLSSGAKQATVTFIPPTFHKPKAGG